MAIIRTFYIIIFILFGFSFYLSAGSVFDSENRIERIVIKIEAESFVVNSTHAEIVEDKRLSGQKGVTLKESVANDFEDRKVPDLYFEIDIPEGRYQLSTYAFTDSLGAELMRKATNKFESLFMKIQIDDNRPTQRVVYVPWDAQRQESGKFNFNGKGQKLKLWLPKGVRLDYINIQEYIPPKVPDVVIDYSPTFTPPSSRPRLWVNNQMLEQVKKNLEKSENIVYWEKLCKSALTPYTITDDKDQEISYDANLENRARDKAFYYLITKNKAIGKEAIGLMTNYLSYVEFGNLLDITREIGRAIYSTSLVYDWCYDLMNDQERSLLQKHLLRLAEEMEIGWPPFRTSVLSGHGSEAQVHRDLLAMSIAIYDEDPLPYQYCSYRVLKELVPMRNWQYQSPRHNQGVNYGAFRSQWDIHAAWLFYRMTGKEVFDENLKRFPYYWLYTRLPNGQMLRDGDGFNAGKPGDFYYWKHPETLFLFYTYTNDPKLKGEFLRQGGIINDPMLYLLLNNPDLVADEKLVDLPLTIDFGPILGSMIARTGWNIGMESDDVVAEIKGGGYHFGNHQHSDAGSLQLFYRGFQVADLGVYRFYGTPYDMNFNKRSLSHSMMLAVDPNEDFGIRSTSNDGGTRFNQRHPESPTIAMNDPWFKNGTVISTDFGPSSNKPLFSYFSVDLKSAYSNKIESYTRQFCFINLENDSIPAIVVLMDKMTTTDPYFKKYWQINSHQHPKITEDGFILQNSMKERIGKTHVQLLIPDKGKYTTELFSGEEANSSFGTKFEIPARVTEWSYPETNGHRIMVSPLKPNEADHFLSTFQFTADNQKPFDIKCAENKHNYQLSFDNYLIVIQKETKLAEESFFITVPKSNRSSIHVVIAGLKDGKWNISNNNNLVNIEVNVVTGKNSAYFQTVAGEYEISPKD